MELDEQTIRMIYKELNISSNKIQNILCVFREKEHKN